MPFWIKIIYQDEREDHLYWSRSLNFCKSFCGNKIQFDATQHIGHIEILTEDWEPGTIASNRQILADFQREPVKGAKRWKPKRVSSKGFA